MTDKQERFCEEYLIDLNATQAAIRAGYSPKTANEQASRLLRNVSVRARLDILMAERSKRTGVNQDRIVRELARIAFYNADDVIDMDTGRVKPDASADDKAAIASVKFKKVIGDFVSIERETKLADKVKALELLMRHNGMLNDKLDVNGNMVIIKGEDGLED